MTFALKLQICIARLIMQDWSEIFSDILKNDEIDQLLRGIHIDNGRNLINILQEGVRYSTEIEIEWGIKDRENGVSCQKKTRIKIGESINSINPDLHNRQV